MGIVMPEEPKKRGFFEGLKRDIKNLAIGVACAPAHIYTDFYDTLGKVAVGVCSIFPVAGSVVTGLYVLKQSYRETGNFAMSAVKGVAAGAAAIVPGVGPAIVAGYAIKNIGEQVERDREVSKQCGNEMTIPAAIKAKYLKGPGVSSVRGKEAPLTQLAPFTPKGVKEEVQDMVAEVQQQKNKKPETNKDLNKSKETRSLNTSTIPSTTPSHTPSIKAKNHTRSNSR
jgi:hypothetical protein